MKLRDLPRALGLTSAAPREYPSEVTTVHLPRDGDIRFAQWTHPGERRKTILQADVDALRDFLRPGDIAIDVGAHTGDSTVPIALAVGPAGVVFALEPNPFVFKVLARNAALNPERATIIPLNVAATPNDGTFEFRYSDSGYCNGGRYDHVSPWKHGHFTRLLVEGRHLPTLLATHPSFDASRLRYVKVDTEGFDRSVVASMTDLLRASRPFIKAEIHKSVPERERVGFYDDLRQLGYRIFKCEDNDFRSLELSRSDLSRWKHYDIFAAA